MHIVTLDYETYFDSEYSLSHMTTEEYIRDPRFEAHGAAVLEGEYKKWLLPHELRARCAEWKQMQKDGLPVAILAHHAHFDGLILSHHFDFCPDIWLDTLSMARVVFGSGVRKSLAEIANRLGLGVKTVPYDLFRGKHWTDLGELTQEQVASGCIHDAVLTRQAFNIMLQGGHPAVPYTFPLSELPIISETVKMFTEPVLVGNLDKLGEAWRTEALLKQDLFHRLSACMGTELQPAMLRKDNVFAAILEYLGVEPETKITKRAAEKAAETGGEPVAKYAFAKSDAFMQELVADEDEDVALAAECRLKAQSSIYLTRVDRYACMALRGPMCIYLVYGAAHTRRWGGGDKTNFQNLPRPDKARPQKGAIRRAIEAPK